MDLVYLALFAQIYLSILNAMLNVDSRRRHTKNNIIYSKMLIICRHELNRLLLVPVAFKTYSYAFFVYAFYGIALYDIRDNFKLHVKNKLNIKIIKYTKY